MRYLTTIGLAVLLAFPAWAGETTDPRYTAEECCTYGQANCPQKACPEAKSCPEPLGCPEPETGTTYVGVHTGLLLGVGDTADRINPGWLVGLHVGHPVSPNLDILGVATISNSGVDNPARGSSSMNMYCVGGGPLLHGNPTSIEQLSLYGTFLLEYCRTNGRRTGFSDDNFVVAPGGGVAYAITPALAVNVGAQYMRFLTGKDNEAILPMAGISLAF